MSRLWILALWVGVLICLWERAEAGEAVRRYRIGANKARKEIRSHSPYGGGSNADMAARDRSAYTRIRSRKGKRGGAVGHRGTRTAYSFQGKKKAGGRSSLRFRKKPPTFKEYLAMSPKERADYMKNLRSASTKSKDGSGAQFGQSFRDPANPRATLVSRSKTGKRSRARAFGTECPPGSADFLRCKSLRIVDQGSGAKAWIAGKPGRKGQVRGRTFVQGAGQKTKPYFYKVDCKARAARSRRGCGSSPTELRSPNGDVWKCHPRRKGDVTVTRCCKNSRRCVTSNQDSDGTVYVGKGGIRTGKTKCYKTGKAKTVRYKDESGRLQSERLYQRYECNATGTTDAQTKAEDMEFSDGVACDGDHPTTKGIVIEKPKYLPDKIKRRSGFEIMEFPHCGEMVAWVQFNGFSQAELEHIGRRLAFQMIVNVHPAGQLRCQDSSTCLTNRKGPNEEDNCYYCDLCNRGKHKVLATADTDSVCRSILSGRVKLSARICPFNEDTSNGLCATATKSIHSTYGKRKGDVDTKIILYMREVDDAKLEETLRREASNPFLWRFAKGALLKTAALRRGLFTERGVSEARRNAWVYEQYMKDKGDKGLPLTCQRFHASYNVFGSSLVKFASALDALKNPEEILRDSVCKSYERYLYKKSKKAGLTG